MLQKIVPSSVDTLVENLKKLGFDAETNYTDRRLVQPGNDVLLKRKFVTAEKNGIYFFAYDSFSQKLSSSSTTTGIYTVSGISPEISCQIYKKIWYNTLLRTSKIKTGVEHIDQQLVICSKNKTAPVHSLSNEVISLFMEIDKQLHPVKFVIENNYVPQIIELKGKMVAGLELNDWKFEYSDLQCLINFGSQFLNHFR